MYEVRRIVFGWPHNLIFNDKDSRSCSALDLDPWGKDYLLELEKYSKGLLYNISSSQDYL